MSATVGGGIQGFTDEDMRDFAGDLGGVWEARFAVGTRMPITFEGAYQGVGQNVDALGLDEDAILVGTGLEANARVNLMDSAFQPYLMAGVGWKHYELTRVDTNTSAVADDDDLLEVPLSAGLAYTVERVILDARGTFRPAFGEDLIGTGDVSLNTWSATVRAGFEF
jgi:opacity protein-like surface antigen